MKYNYWIYDKSDRVIMHGSEDRFTENDFRLRARVIMGELEDAHYCEYSANNQKRKKTIANY